ncbi:NAD(FAD)-dependent dehydrogenase [Thermoplasmatales archaeon SG8-52-4]|nr:MAG: NAD(FAD)-dependent dehydrogenase [Thermoplasmatales archaeon SG8-52-4]
MSDGKKIVIIGGGAGGGTAAQFARKTDRKSKIIIFEKGKYAQYSKCGLPYTISKDIDDIYDLIEFSNEWFLKAGIDLKLNSKVEKIDINKKKITVNKDNKTFDESYDKLIIATGAKPSIPPIKNIIENDKIISGVFTLRTIDDAKNISIYCSKSKKAVIVGAGLIGLELAESLYKNKLKVTVVEALPDILANTLDKDMSKIVFDNITKFVDVITDHIVTRVESESGKIKKVIIKDNKTGKEKEIVSDIVIIATGLIPQTSLAKDIGCKLSNKGYIIVNEKCETSLKDIYAIGDCTEFINFVTKNPTPIGLGSIAVRQGISAGINAAGGSYTLLDGVLQTCTSRFFELEIAAVGSCNDKLIFGKFNGSSLPDYYPGGKQITIKVFTDENGKIMGAQAVGDNAAQRINTYAAAILGGLDIEKFRKLETAYAPPVAPTLDSITLVCDIISAKLRRR